MVIVTLGGGLGNQLFQYTIGRLLAIKNNTTLKLYISNFKYENNRSYKLNYFNIQEAFATEEEVEKLIHVYYSNSLYARIHKKIHQNRPKYKKKYFIESDYWIFEPELVKITSDVLLEGFWQHYKYYENIPQEILQELILKEEFKTSLTNSIINSIEQDDSSVSIHIRRGDYVSDPNNLNYFGALPMQYYYDAVNYVNENIQNPKFYIFSDDLNWVKDHFKINAPITFVDIAGGIKDYLELDAMSKCRHNIIANSSFSWWGAFLNKNTDKIIIAPKNWVVKEDINKNIQIHFPGWIKL
jgi:hypothetical protein